jgi:hypothetical protein
MSEHMSMNDEIDSAAQQEAKALQTAPVLTAKRAILILAVFFLAQAVITFVVGAIIGAYIAIAQGISEPTAVTEAFKPFDLSVSMIGLFLAALIALRMTRNTFGGAHPSRESQLRLWRVSWCHSFMRSCLCLPFHHPMTNNGDRLSLPPLRAVGHSFNGPLSAFFWRLPLKSSSFEAYFSAACRSPVAFWFRP